MKRIMLMSAKGGSGKSTLATNLAAYYALDGHRVVLADFDPQGSCMDWLAVRPGERARIEGVAATLQSFSPSLRRGYLIMDTPGSVRGRALTALTRRADNLIIPVTPSPMDIRATARFIEELLTVRRVRQERIRICVAANRVRRQDQAFDALLRFLDRLHIPMAVQFNDAEIYVQAAGTGLSVFEMPGPQADDESRRWHPLLRWLAGKPVESKTGLPTR